MVLSTLNFGEAESEPVSMASFFILKNRWFKQFCRVAVCELGKIFLILPHKIHDVMKTLNVEHIALQNVDHNGTQLLTDTQMKTVSQ